jgi:type II secretory pathway predicted ATPase ExeA/outer membrane protein OmpA-like peptidoglycan-associated protein
MYPAYYHLRTDPFCLTPDARFCFRHRSYARARAYLQFALNRAEGFVTITGAPGTGKTTLLNELLAESEAARFAVARLNTPQLGPDDLLHMVAYAFGQVPDGQSKAYVLHHLERYLQRQSHAASRTLLVIDEAQDLSPAALEEVRLLTNLEFNAHPLLQVFLVGQEQLDEIIDAAAMVQLQQRLIAHARIEPMMAEESADYIRYRLRAAGWSADPRMGEDVLHEIAACAHGVPRRINLLCSRLFLYGAVEQKHRFDVADVRQVVEELLEEHLITREEADTHAAAEPPAVHAQAERVDPHLAQDEIGEAAAAESVRVTNAPRGGVRSVAEFRSSVAARRLELVPGAGPAREPVVSGRVYPDADPEPSLPESAPAVTARSDPVPQANVAARDDAAREAPESDVDSVHIPADVVAQALVERDAASRNRYLRRPLPAFGFALAAAGVLLGAVLYVTSVNTPDARGTSVDPAPTVAALPPVVPAARPEVTVAEPQTHAPPLQRRVEDQLRAQGLAVEDIGPDGLVIHPDADATFDFGSAKINGVLRETLDKVAVVLRDAGEINVRVAGHSDNVGREEVNRDLSQDRASTVASYLVREGISARRLRTEAMGFDQPKNPDAPQLNRRVEIYLEPVAAARRE